MDFQKAKLIAKHIAHNATFIQDFAGDVGGMRMAQPDANWTKSRMRSIAFYNLEMCKEFGIDPLDPFGIGKDELEKLKKEIENTPG